MARLNVFQRDEQIGEISEIFKRFLTTGIAAGALVKEEGE